MDMELVSWDVMSSLLCREPEEVVQVYGFLCTYVTSYGDIRCDNQSYVVVAQ